MQHAILAQPFAWCHKLLSTYLLECLRSSKSLVQGLKPKKETAARHTDVRCVVSTAELWSSAVSTCTMCAWLLLQGSVERATYEAKSCCPARAHTQRKHGLDALQ